jgi:thymidine phosphorylase
MHLAEHLKELHPQGMPLVRAGIDTHQEPVVYMRSTCAVCKSEGFEAEARVWVEVGARSCIATLNVVTDGTWLDEGVAALSDAAWNRLQPSALDRATFRHADSPESTRFIRSKVYGHTLARDEYSAIMHDAVAGTLSDLDLTAFLTACASRDLDVTEMTALTLAMVDAGERLTWNSSPILDKHCVGGLAGNRTTPIVVAIVAACGGIIPKTSSRAITSPAGTADAMETLAPVDLPLGAMRRVVEREGGCIVWGGSVGLSPADDALIRLDSDAQLVASVLSKKLSAGSTHVLIDMPVGPTAKVRSADSASSLGGKLIAVANVIGLSVRVHLSDGSQPVGRGIGPALEARDLLAVLERRPEAPCDLRERALELAGALLELGGVRPGDGYTRAQRALDDGSALHKFEAICEAQGGRRIPPRAPHQAVIAAPYDGVVSAIDNRLLSRLAKLAGAPRSPAAGVDLHVRAGTRVATGTPLATLHATTEGELEYAQAYRRHHPGWMQVTPE